jgi:hypothetical protein
VESRFCFKGLKHDGARLSSEGLKDSCEERTWTQEEGPHTNDVILIINLSFLLLFSHEAQGIAFAVINETLALSLIVLSIGSLDVFLRDLPID